MRLSAWRIVQEHHQGTAFDGEGARLYGGRWNRPGTRLAYCSESIALATLEILVNLDFGQALGRYVKIPVTFDEGLCRRIDDTDLPADWAADPAPPSTQLYGSSWAAGLRSVVLAVPSAVVEPETNYLINPLHPDFAKLQIGPASPMALDPRLAP